MPVTWESLTGNNKPIAAQVVPTSFGLRPRLLVVCVAAETAPILLPRPANVVVHPDLGRVRRVAAGEIVVAGIRREIGFSTC